MLWILSEFSHPFDVLSPWRRGETLDDVVFRVAAIFPMECIVEGIQHQLPFDVNGFVAELWNSKSGLIH